MSWLELTTWYKQLQEVAESINSAKIIYMKSAVNAFDEKVDKLILE